MLELKQFIESIPTVLSSGIGYCYILTSLKKWGWNLPLSILVWFFLSTFNQSYAQSQSGSLGINETYFETLESKYYNQTIEIHNPTTNEVDISLYQLIAGNLEDGLFIASRTNNIISWSSSRQTEFSDYYSNIFFTSLLPPGGVAVILDPGYRFEENFGFTHTNRTNALYLLTTSSGVLGSGNFMKDTDVLRLVNTATDPQEIVDEFHNQNSPQGYGVVKINLSKKGLADNTAARPETIGYIEDLQDLYTTLPADRISLDEIHQIPSIVGLPQIYNLTCKYLTTVSHLCNITLRFNRHDYIKMYHYPQGSANLITESDDIQFLTGQSSPITLFGLEPGIHKINTTDASFPPIEKTINPFDHPLASEIFITEIYYSTNKDLTWMEVYSLTVQNLSIELQTFNSDYRENNYFDLGEIVLKSGYNVLGYRNQDFDQEFTNADVIPIPDQFAITAKGVVALSSQGKYLDIVHYDKSWFEESVDGRSLQRIDTDGLAFSKKKWSVSTEVDKTPFAPNILTRNIHFTVNLLHNRLPLSVLKINFYSDFDTGGTLTAYLYDPQGVRIGRVFSQKVSRGYQVPLFICLKKVRKRFEIHAGNYSLMFLFDSDDGKKTLYREFTLE